jgi:hypothetical protein
LKNNDTGAFNIKAILDSKPVDSEQSQDMIEPLSSSCCDVEDEEQNVSLAQLLQGGSKLHLKSMYEVSAISKRLQHTAKPPVQKNQRPKGQSSYFSQGGIRVQEATNVI